MWLPIFRCSSSIWVIMSTHWVYRFPAFFVRLVQPLYLLFQAFDLPAQLLLILGVIACRPSSIRLATSALSRS